MRGEAFFEARFTPRLEWTGTDRGSLQNHEKYLCMSVPVSGPLSQARRGKKFFRAYFILSLVRRGAPLRGVAGYLEFPFLRHGKCNNLPEADSAKQMKIIAEKSPICNI
jgi:hypothetical protein